LLARTVDTQLQDAASTLHGSGYIAAFSGGLLFGHLASNRIHDMVISGEGISELLAMLTWTLFGAVAVGQVWGELNLAVILYAVLSLTLVRMAPVVVSLAGTGEKLEAKMFLAWFGPRGLATIVFFLIVAEEHLPSEMILQDVVVVTICLSILFHGVTADAWNRGMLCRVGKT
jgi:NhaP-type Na+/H+ or K+/H+ antiporter